MWNVAVVALLTAAAACDGRTSPDRAAPAPTAVSATSALAPTPAAPATEPPGPSLAACTAEHGSLDTSRVSGRRVAVYLPPCARELPDRRYPAVYLLHGAATDETQWPAIGLVSTADEPRRSRPSSW